MVNEMPSIPTLTLGPSQILTNPQDIILYILRSVFLNPGDTSSMIENEIISFRKLEATYGKNGHELATKLSSELNTVFGRYFSGTGIVADVTYTSLGDGKYALGIEVRDEFGNLKLIRGKVDVIDINELVLNFEKEE